MCNITKLKGDNNVVGKRIQMDVLCNRVAEMDEV
jgi:hypothetical protein